MDKAVIADWKARVKYGEERPDPQIVYDDGSIRLILGGLRAGQIIPSHPEAKAVYHFLEGEGQMTVNEEQIIVSPGVIVVVPDGDKRGIRAYTQLAFLAIRISPATGW